MLLVGLLSALPGWGWAALLSGVLGALSLWWAWRLARARRQGAQAQEVAQALAASPEPGEGARATGEVAWRSVSEGVRGEVATTEGHSGELLVGLASEVRVCPGCQRTFPAIFERCPYDGQALERGEASAERARGRCSCARCGRRYEAGAAYCPVDGLALSRLPASRGSVNARFRVCRTCGYEAHGEEQTCPEDGHPLVPLESPERAEIAPTVPLMRCRRCGRYGQAGQVRCEVDDTLMMPELNVRLTAFPPTGFGVRRKVCTRCGVQYSGRCEFCSYDGEPLVGMN
ncbi:hypothetical protein DL240_07430 [Lujinxingia litoralis]|uniref:Uncharacterized protein n=2 Tax=Lujinxingia litoralis TaxID=2211119 RepID=A0A328CA09_9DELT|nr:hypothetical protein DL240_07430 [Lujinxingia litoralis]